MFAIMTETTSDNTEALSRYYDGSPENGAPAMLPQVYLSFTEATLCARALTSILLEKADSEHIGEFSVLHSGGLVSTLYVVELKNCP